jgi:hypothetical protein
MSGSVSTPKLDSCGCCAAEPAPSAIHNRPGLPALSYRIGTYGAFFQRMLDQIHSVTPPGASAPPLASLTTRAADDPAIALLDAWAVVADILTFYQERIANEGYLGTATERRSVLELARAIGYELAPGVAASAYLQFTVEEIIGAATAGNLPGVRVQSPAGPGSSPFNAGLVDIAQGTQVQSVPVPGQLPQTFETAADFQVRAQWNTLYPRLTQPQFIDLNAGPSGLALLYLQGTSTSLKRGDRLLLVEPQPSSPFLIVDPQPGPPPAIVTALNVVPDSANGRTRVECQASPSLPTFVPGSFPSTDLKVQNVPFNQDSVQTYILQNQVSEGDLQAFLKRNGWDAGKLMTLINGLPQTQSSVQVFAFGARAGFFGHNALPATTTTSTTPATTSTSSTSTYNTATPPATTATSSTTTTKPQSTTTTATTSWADPPIWGNSGGVAYTAASAFLERSFPQVVAPGWALLESPGLPPTAFPITGVVEETVADYGQSGKCTGLLVGGAGNPAFKVRETTAFIQSQQLALADLPLTDDDLSSANAHIWAGETKLMLDSLVLGLAPGQPVALTGRRADAPGVTANEVLLLQDIVHTGGFTTLQFQTATTFSYSRNTLTLSANVTLATHGATVQEVLGSGDGSQTSQSFTLKRPPLTYVSAPTPSGIASTLQIRVNGVQWQEAPTLYGLGPSDKEYIVRRADDGTSTVTFGDPASRLKTGPQNVSATYRTGIGLAGNVDAGTLSLLQSRPPGLRGITNPLPAGGGADPQRMADARKNAPLTALTLDRIVSLDDYQSFAQAFAGVGKAQAVSLWSGQIDQVCITVAAANGDSIDPTMPLYQTLVQAIDLAHDPVQRFVVMGYQPQPFNLAATLVIDQPTYDPDAVHAQVGAVLATAFSFEQRAFGQAVTAAEILALIQSVPGVIASHLTQLYLTGDTAGASLPEPQSFLPASGASLVNGVPQPAQLLLLNPLGVSLTEVAS